MSIFHFEAIDKSGKKVLDSIEAENLNSAINKIRELSYFPVHIYEKPLKERKARLPITSNVFLSFANVLRMSGVSQKQLMLFTRQLAVLSSAGVPMLRSLNILKEQQKPGAFKDILEHIPKEVESGSSLSDALGKYPKVFSTLYINMVKAGEIGGVLETVLSRLADFAEKNQRLTNKVRAALIYPIFVVVIASLILTILITFVVPKFMSIFSELGVNMPLPTLILLGMSSFLSRLWYLFPVFFFLAFLLYRYAVRLPQMRYRVDTLKLRMPLLGILLKKIIIARFSRTLGTLIRSGIPILHALNIAKDTTGNTLVSDALKKVHDSIREGDTIAVPLAKSGVFAPMVVDMISVGEETGQLDTMLLKIADTYEDEVETTISGLTSILEPVLIIFMGVIVGFIIISMLLPLISLISTLGR
ncbi:MAG: type II secretion system F family protein [Candidatus Omnitrophota bacterium]